jgi:hypothetical protein
MEQLNIRIIEYQNKQEEQIGEMRIEVFRKSEEIMKQLTISREEKESYGRK